MERHSRGIRFNIHRIIWDHNRHLSSSCTDFVCVTIRRAQISFMFCSNRLQGYSDIDLRYTHWMKIAEFSSKFQSSWTEWLTQSHPGNQAHENILLFCAQHLGSVQILQWKKTTKIIITQYMTSFLMGLCQYSSPQMSVTYCGNGLIGMCNTTFCSHIPLCLLS